MKNGLTLTLLATAVVSSVCVIEVTPLGTISDTFYTTGRAARYTFLAAKNGTQAVVNGIAMPLVVPYKSFKNYPKLSSAATGAILVGLAALWYTSPDGFMSHPYVAAITNGALKISADSITYAIAFLEKCPEYAAWLKEFSCQHLGQNCPLPQLPLLPASDTPAPDSSWFTNFPSIPSLKFW